MNALHEDLAQGRWQTLSFFEQMANVGSEVERAIKWRQKKQVKLMNSALARGLELLSLTINSNLSSDSRLKELLRVKECLLDSFMADNIYQSKDSDWQSYFQAFTYGANLQAGR